MPVRAGISGDCLVEILTDSEAGFIVAIRDNERVILEKPGVGPAIILRSAEWYGITEMTDWVEMSGIGWDLFYMPIPLAQLQKAYGK